jgi:hypothetical protein
MNLLERLSSGRTVRQQQVERLLGREPGTSWPAAEVVSSLAT